MGDPKIESLKNEIAKNIVNEFNLQISEVLSICESEIERLMLLHLYRYFQNFRENEYWDKRYFQLEFIEDEVILGLPDVSSMENLLLEARVKKYNYRKFDCVFLNYIGFKVNDDQSESISINWAKSESNSQMTKSKSTSIDKLIFREFEVRPQYPVTIDGNNYRLDIAIILNRKTYNGKILESRKIALECDGYDYHSSPEQKRNDDIRTRKLKKSGWKEVLRYSGRELYNLKRHEVDSLFKEIVDVLYI
jgi:very-short-patch-repair endonuclease